MTLHYAEEKRFAIVIEYGMYTDVEWYDDFYEAVTEWNERMLAYPDASVELYDGTTLICE